MNNLPGEQTTGGELLARSLARAGVREVFTLHGGHLDAFLVACADHAIRLTDCRHEAAAGHAADGFVRALGATVGVCVVTAGPGFTNALTAVANAYLDGVATLFVVGAAPLREAEFNPLQGGFDQIAMAAPVTKWAHRVTNAERIPDLVREAVRIATSGRPGPVLLEIPIDVMFAMVDEAKSDWREGAPSTLRTGVPEGATERLLDLLRSARRPVLIAGGGVAQSPEAPRRLSEFAAMSGVPVIHNYRGAGVLAPQDPANYGGASVLASVRDLPDVVVLLGARRGMFLGGRGTGIIPADARIAQIDVEVAELGRLGPVEVAIAADVGEALRALVLASCDEWPDWKPWCAALGAAREAGRAPPPTSPSLPGAGLYPDAAARAVIAAAPSDAIWVLDGGEAASWFSGLLEPSGPGHFLATGYLGCLGVSAGFAIGAQRAHPDQRVIVVAGDGGVGFHIQEFDTMKRHGLPIVTIVMNNAGWGMSRSGQDIVYGENRRTTVALEDTDYHRVAEGFGAFGVRVESIDKVGQAVADALASGRPACVNLITDPSISHPVTAGMVGVVTQPGEILIPYYENIVP